jgi:hypothetical protein
MVSVALHLLAFVPASLDPRPVPDAEQKALSDLVTR